MKISYISLLTDCTNPSEFVPFYESFIVAHSGQASEAIGHVRFINMDCHVYGAAITIFGKLFATMPHIGNDAVVRYLNDPSVLEYINTIPTD